MELISGVFRGPDWLEFRIAYFSHTELEMFER
jgi:hypothetical protein